VRRWMRVSTPVNKAAPSGLRGQPPQIPRPPGSRSLLLDAPHQMLVVFAESGLNLLCIYAVVPCLLLGLGVTDADWYTVMGRMIFLNMLLYFSPTPGGSGIAEGGFVLLFSSVVPAGTVGIVAVCWRLIAEYLPFLIGFYYTVTVFGREFLRRY